VAGIAGSLFLGKYLDKHRCFKKMQILLALGVSFTVFLTFLVLHFNGPSWLTILITILGGIPISSISLVSYQF
jgi:predicted MFS family arabinose efflux permease